MAPPKSPNPKDVFVTIRLTQAEADALDTHVQTSPHIRSRSAAIRAMIRTGINRRERGAQK